MRSTRLTLTLRALPLPTPSWRRPSWMLPVWLVAGLALALTLAGLAGRTPASPSAGRPSPAAAVARPGGAPAPDFAGGAAAERVPRPDTATRVIAAVGDIACDPTGGAFHGGRGTADACHMRAVSDLLLDLDPALVLTLGDNQYENGTLTKYRRSYAPTWGRLKARTRPSPGNHEYNTKGPPATTTTSAPGPATAPPAGTASTSAPGT
jgi:hypothetical protein